MSHCPRPFVCRQVSAKHHHEPQATHLMLAPRLVPGVLPIAISSSGDTILSSPRKFGGHQIRGTKFGGPNSGDTILNSPRNPGLGGEGATVLGPRIRRCQVPVNISAWTSGNPATRGGRWQRQPALRAGGLPYQPSRSPRPIQEELIGGAGFTPACPRGCRVRRDRAERLPRASL